MARGPLLPLDLLVLDRDADTPLNRQLYTSLRSHILDGRLTPTTKLPATRKLADELGVSRNTVIAAYDALLAEGFLDSVRGSGTRVAAQPQPPAGKRAHHRPSMLPALSARGTRMATQPHEATAGDKIGFHPGRPEIATFPFANWTKLVAAQMRSAPESNYGYQMVGGHPRLRAAIAEYLRVSRGVKCVADQVIVVTGAQAALDLIARVFMDPGDAFQIEDPGYLGAYNACLNAGGQPLPLVVKPDGWHLERSPRPPRLIFVTPSCQWPLGLVMPLDVRLELLQIAERQDSWIVEDDYDSEYRFRGHPIPAMQGLDDSGRVIYLGTMSKTMFPSLRVGYLVVPAKLADGLVTALASTGQYPPLFIQMALAEFISQGGFAAHLRRMRRLYARRQREFIESCRARLNRWLTVNERDTGMQVIGRFTRPMDDGVVLNLALRRGVDFMRLSTQYRHGTPEHGLILGYAGVNQDQARVGIERLRTVFQKIG
jgi:GntR family transcriptional regulator/MocR family aminotransferase